MAHQETLYQPELAEMSIDEKWDRLHDFFTLDHSISYKTRKRMGTVQEWVDDTVEASGVMMGRFMGPLATLMGNAATKLTPNMVLKQAIYAVLYSDQMMHGPGEYEISEPKNGEITVRFKNCLRLTKKMRSRGTAILAFWDERFAKWRKCISPTPTTHQQRWAMCQQRSPGKKVDVFGPLR